MWTRQNSVSHQICHTNASDRTRSQQIGGQNVFDRVEAYYPSGHNRRQIAFSGIQSYQTLNNHDLWWNLANLTTTRYELPIVAIVNIVSNGWTNVHETTTILVQYHIHMRIQDTEVFKQPIALGAIPVSVTKCDYSTFTDTQRQNWVLMKTKMLGSSHP